MHTLSPQQITYFQHNVFDFYKSNGRSFVWRNTHNPYYIWLSEIMLQQTQTSRVTTYYETFTKTFPTVNDLAKTSTSTLLKLWQGLGYNRRALHLQSAAKIVSNKYNGKLPTTKEDLVSLPGIGDATAGAIMCYAYNTPEPFIETNIRTVFIHEFFSDRKTITDKQILPLVSQTLAEDNPRDWFYALTDYGVYIKKTLGNKSRKSKHYTKQSKFEGSNRQKRSKILKALLQKPQSKTSLSKDTNIPVKEISKPLKELVNEKFITVKRGKYRVV